jgi:hypothetical protein
MKALNGTDLKERFSKIFLGPFPGFPLGAWEHNINPIPRRFVHECLKLQGVYRPRLKLHVVWPLCDLESQLTTLFDTAQPPHGQ